MLELTGTIEKIEKSNISNVDLLHIKIDTSQTQMILELTNKINPFKESDSVKMIFDTNPATEKNQKLILNGYIYSINQKEKNNSILISIGGLQLKIETPDTYGIFDSKKDISIQLF